MGAREEIYAAALAARDKAYANESGFAVGAAVRGASGRIYAGCNVENASYPEGWCAETTAIGQMIMAGEREIVEVAVVSDGERLGTPCGGCRQRIAEFAGNDVPVHVGDLSGVRQTFTIGALLPAAFELKER